MKNVDSSNPVALTKCVQYRPIDLPLANFQLI